MEEIFALRTVDELEAWCARQPVAAARRDLLSAFEWYRRYRTASAWNRLVIVCETLAIIGWGDVSPVQAVANPWVQKQVLTKLQHRDFGELPGSRRTWSLWRGMYVPTEQLREVKGDAKRLRTQRVPLPSTPFRIAIQGFYLARPQPFVVELERLRRLIGLRLAKSYGHGFDQIDVLPEFSYPMSGSRRGVGYFHDEADVIRHPGVSTMVVPRLDIRRLTRRQGRLSFTAVRRYTEAELKRSLREQKTEFVDDASTILDALEVKLRRKSPLYRCVDLRADLAAVLHEWISPERPGFATGGTSSS